MARVDDNIFTEALLLPDTKVHVENRFKKQSFSFQDLFVKGCLWKWSYPVQAMQQSQTAVLLFGYILYIFKTTVHTLTTWIEKILGDAHGGCTK